MSDDDSRESRLSSDWLRETQDRTTAALEKSADAMGEIRAQYNATGKNIERLAHAQQISGIAWGKMREAFAVQMQELREATSDQRESVARYERRRRELKQKWWQRILEMSQTGRGIVGLIALSVLLVVATHCALRLHEAGLIGSGYESLDGSPPEVSESLSLPRSSDPDP